MKRIIDVPEEGVNACKLWVEMGVASWQDTVIANSIPYEERQLSHEQECIIEELENICINNEYVLDLLAKLKNEYKENNKVISITDMRGKKND